MRLSDLEANALSGLLRSRPGSGSRRFDAQTVPLQFFEAASSPGVRKRLVDEGLVVLRRGPPNGGWVVAITTRGKRAYHIARRSRLGKEPSAVLPS